MSAIVLYLKKIGIVLIVILTVGFAYSAVAYSNVLTNAHTVALNKDFYYLVDTSTHTQAVSTFAQLQGGAGYLLEADSREYVAYNVYFSEQDGTAAKQALEAYQTQPSLYTVSVADLVFKTKEEKKQAPIIVSAFSCLDGCMQVLNREITRLDNGATQQSSKRILQTLIKQFMHLSKEYQTSFPEYAAVCANATSQLQACTNDIVYVKDLRYLLCDLGVSYVQLSKDFTL